MGIVERAVEMAQSEAKAVAAETPPMPDDPVLRTSAEPAQPAVLPHHDAGSAVEADPESAIVAHPSIQIDLERLRELGRLPPEESSRQAKEEMRRIKWPLLGAIKGSADESPARNNVIQVTSALPGEGKTYTALMLALSIVLDRELRVVLVDGDVARPGLTPAFGLEDSPGLIDVLEERDVDIGSVTYATDVEGLFVVPAGKWHERASELLASSRMPQVIDELIRRAGNGVVILDSPPLLATNEAQVLTRHVGQVLLVVRAAETGQQLVKDALALIDSAASTSAVLNCVRPSILDRYYGGHYYGYGSGYGDDTRSSRRRTAHRVAGE